MESSSNRDRGRIIIELLSLLLLLYGGPAVGIDDWFCRADSIKGTTGGRGGKQAGAREGKRKLFICRGTVGPLCCSLDGRKVRQCSQGPWDLLA